MAQFEPFDDGVEVNGQTFLAVIKGMPVEALEDQARAIAADHGVEDPQPGEWYPQQVWLDVFKEMYERFGESTMQQIGTVIPENADWPEDVNTLVGGLESIDKAYHMNHRGGEIGHYKAEQVSDDKVIVECENPYPCKFDLGIIKETAKQFAEDEFPQVKEVGKTCRDEGGEKCVYEVSWW